MESRIQDCLGFYLLQFMAIYNINKKIITITITLAKKGTHWSCAQEPETTYKAQHRGYYLHKNIKLILNLCPIYNCRCKTIKRSVTNELESAWASMSHSYDDFSNCTVYFQIALAEREFMKYV